VAGLNASHLPLALIAVIFAALGFATACTLVPTRRVLQQHLALDRMGRVTALSEAANALAILIARSRRNPRQPLRSRRHLSGRCGPAGGARADRPPQRRSAAKMTTV